jgi:hypothetical protein
MKQKTEKMQLIPSITGNCSSRRAIGTCLKERCIRKAETLGENAGRIRKNAVIMKENAVKNQINAERFGINAVKTKKHQSSKGSVLPCIM